MLEASIQRNDKKAYWMIGIFSVVVFVIIVALGKYKLNVHPSFDVHIFARIDAITNSVVTLFLLAGLWAVSVGKYKLHRTIMIGAMLLSVIFLLSYIAHHLLAGEARFGDINHDGIVSVDEKLQAGSLRYVYFLLLGTHIILAAFILPFILFTAYRGLTGEYEKHKKLARYTWPLWLYVAITGPVVYLLISPYYT